jgi:Polyketide cyclase / dehydrase and lipid transport
MAHVELDIGETPISPERVISALTDFSEQRPEIWPGLHPSLYEVRSIGDTWAEVKEGSQVPGLTVWAIECYDSSVPGTVRWTIKESNLFAPGGSVSARVDPRSGGGSRIHITWNRTGVGLKGRMLVGIIRLSGGKPVAAAIRQGLDTIPVSVEPSPEPPHTRV